MFKYQNGTVFKFQLIEWIFVDTPGYFATKSMVKIYDFLFSFFLKEQEISKDCQIQMAEVRQELMEDYSISPEIMTNCQREISASCENGLQKGGKTIHCLMNLARPARDQGSHKTNIKLSAVCERAVSVPCSQCVFYSDNSISFTYFTLCSLASETHAKWTELVFCSNRQRKHKDENENCH